MKLMLPMLGKMTANDKAATLVSPWTGQSPSCTAGTWNTYIKRHKLSKHRTMIRKRLLAISHLFAWNIYADVSPEAVRSIEKLSRSTTSQGSKMRTASEKLSNP